MLRNQSVVQFCPSTFIAQYCGKSGLVVQSLIRLIYLLLSFCKFGCELDPTKNQDSWLGWQCSGGNFNRIRIGEFDGETRPKAIGE